MNNKEILDYFAVLTSYLHAPDVNWLLEQRILREKEEQTKQADRKLSEKQQLVIQREIEDLRHNFNKTGEISGTHNGDIWKLVLGHRQKRGSKAEVIQNSVCRFHPNKNFISLWRTKAELDDYLLKRKQNSESMMQTLKKELSGSSVLSRLPHPPAKLRTSNASAYELTPKNLQKIKTLVSQLKTRLMTEYAMLPTTKPQYVALETNPGFTPLLLIQFNKK